MGETIGKLDYYIECWGDCIKGLSKNGYKDIIGKTVLMADGQELGTISDVIFNPENGEIMGYEISKGIIDDLLTGRNILSGYFSPYSGKDVIVVPMNGEIQVKPNNGGIINKLSDESDHP